MRFLNDWWGINENITPLEIVARAAVMFVITLLMLRIFGMKAFGKSSAFDTIITFFIGGILVRGIVGATPFISTIAATIAIMAVHKLFSLLSLYSRFFGKIVKGEERILYKSGKFYKKNMQQCAITENDVFEEMRMVMQKSDLKDIQEIKLERTGKISFVKSETE